MSAGTDTEGQDRVRYAALKDYGFSPQKAAELILDAKRGVSSAEAVIRAALKETERPTGSEK